MLPTSIKSIIRKLITFSALATLSTGCGTGAIPEGAIAYEVVGNGDVDTFKMKQIDNIDAREQLVQLACIKAVDEGYWHRAGMNFLLTPPELGPAKATIGERFALVVLEEPLPNTQYAIVHGLLQSNNILDEKTRQRLEGKTEDRYDVLILQVQLLANGLAVVDFEKNAGCDPYVDLFEEAQASAKTHKEGFWGEDGGIADIKFTED